MKDSRYSVPATYKTYNKYKKDKDLVGVKIEKILGEYENIGLNEEEKSLVRLVTKMFHYRLNGGGVHIFIDSISLFDFLRNTEIKETESLSKYINNADYYYLKGFENFRAVNIYVHHRKLNRKSFQYILFDENVKNGINNGILCYEENMISKPAGDKYIEKDRLIRNLIFYMEAFPDCITDGTPDEKRRFHNFYHAKNRIKLTTHESLIDRSGVTPHMRRGHFRRLTSERYKEARGKVIFVHSCMVKGKAKTVHDNSHKEEAFA